ncbi:hypothetical protein [Bradyrhizobium japonicum]|uniref:hypothetical protein n=1 Tax=Bradyrhizobium japonicum TaxID=375 RepID=UPI001B89E4F8|nr:hypothetical protein [Bradyrhizobium japonicum]MBR0970356.1 hypothetical protein [Bradyrhizobium japonicum]
MLKYIAKISMDIFPSVLATIIGAYIVNHYINAKPAADAPAAVMAPADSGKNGKPAAVANLPAPGVKAKGISEKSMMDKPAAEKAADHSGAEPKTADKSADKTTEKAIADVAPAEAAPRGKPSAREKALAKSTPSVTAPAPAAPVVEANSAAAAPAATPDANDLVRAAIERLRKSPEGKAAEAKSTETKSSEKAPEFAVRDAARTPEAPRVVATEPSMVRPLPPPITVSTPAPEAYGNNDSSQAPPPYTASVGGENPNRLTPPADIPVPMIAPPLDLRADAGASMPRPKTNVADDMLSGVKSMFHSVLPKSVTPD